MPQARAASASPRASMPRTHTRAHSTRRTTRARRRLRSDCASVGQYHAARGGNLRGMRCTPCMIAFVAVAVVAALDVTSCTDATLYDPVDVPSQADKVAFTGNVCTDNPAERSFPLRVVFVMDDS